MKKFTLLFATAAMITFASCKKEVTIESDGTATDTTVVIDEVAPPVNTTDTIVVKQEESDGTSINVNSGGVSVDSKDGTKKTTVNMTKDGAGVEIKK